MNPLTLILLFFGFLIVYFVFFKEIGEDQTPPF